MPDNTGGLNRGHLPQEAAILRRADAIDTVAHVLDTDDRLVAAMVAGQVQRQRQLDMQARLVSQMQKIYDTSDESDIVGRFPIDMSHSVPADKPLDDPYEVVRTPNEDGPSRIEAITLGWSSGTDNGTGIRVETGDGLKLIPRNGEDDFIAFDDFVQTFEMDYDLDPGEEIVARTVNFDDQNPHFVNIVPHVTEFDDDVPQNTPVEEGGGE